MAWATGRTLAYWQTAREGGIAAAVDLRPLVLLPERAELNRRIDARLAAMFEGGALEEVAALLARGDVPADAPVRRAIGVAEIGRLLAGESTRNEALEATARATRRYAKRQYTWFRHQPPSDWRRVTQYSFNENYFGETLLFVH